MLHIKFQDHQFTGLEKIFKGFFLYCQDSAFYFIFFLFFCSDKIVKLCVCVCGISTVATGW